MTERNESRGNPPESLDFLDPDAVLHGIILGEVRPGYCANCLVARTWAKDRCQSCYMYLRRTGRERPEELIIRQGQRIIDAEVARRAS